MDKGEGGGCGPLMWIKIPLVWILLPLADVDKGGGWDAYPQNVDNLPVLIFEPFPKWFKQTVLAIFCIFYDHIGTQNRFLPIYDS